MRWSDLCLICAGQQELVANIRERGPFDRSHDYTRVLFCSACSIGELRSFSYDGFVVFGEEDEVMVWSSVLSAPDVDRLRTAFTCPTPLAGICECPQHVRAYDTSLRVNKTRLPEYGPDRHSPAGRTTATLELVDGLVEFRSVS
ncbi:hypothetical protein SAMN04488564_1021106 [Lentzea waywayandensis]|uniref:Uncharacterized protein n=1 Tax=Lentzea waywayandensis TaxID=84724 RepID=A0A1I6DNH8_9PSEU|nr:hypothetical protein [Lentzea waywayandensis]SFR06922.1 hypothetical protein SAMN04488564_1021106 [Lentzea waywayandensis]